MDTKGTFRVRQCAAQFLLEEDRHGWHIIESLDSFEQANQAIDEYRRDGHQIEWYGH